MTPTEPVLRVGALALYDGLFCTVKVRITRVWYVEEARVRRLRVEFVVTSRNNLAFPAGTVEESSIHWLRQRDGAPFDTVEVAA
jgi:hypothetical protein